jgi:hypothetical protein
MRGAGYVSEGNGKAQSVYGKGKRSKVKNYRVGDINEWSLDLCDREVAAI